MKDFKLKRAIIKVDTVKDINGKREFPISDNHLGYIRLRRASTGVHAPLAHQTTPERTPPMARRVLIMGAAGRDFHNFNTVFRGDQRYDVVDLPQIGIKGNSHMMMMDRNSDQVAGVIQAWLAKQGLYK